MKQAIPVLLFILSNPIAYAQADSTRLALYNFVENVNAFTGFYPQEKVYLHFDNSSYFLGETIWFAAYVATAPTLEATDVSRTLYVELLTPEGNVSETRKLLIENGRCHGEFSLPEKSLFSGFYQVRAYTRYMLNFGNEALFSRVFPVYDKPDEGKYAQKRMTGNRLSIPDKRQELDRLDELNIAFFPEGGQLVNGLESKIAFKATDKTGMNTDITGTVYNSKKEAVANLQSLHRGMGYFLLTPASNEEYYAEIKSSDGKKKKIDLPNIQATGYVMTVQRTEHEIQANISQHNVEPLVLGLASLCRGEVNAFAEVDMRNSQQATVKIPTESLETGVNQLTLYDKHGRALCERLFFVNHKDKQLEIKQTQNKDRYLPFEKIDMEFEVNDVDSLPVETSFSLSVRDAGTTTRTSYADNMLTNMLLSSELRGYIENPSYYFESDDRQHQTSLDLLLLTQGWRRYVWEEMAGIDDFRLVHPAEKGILINGTVKTFVRHKEKKDVDVSIILQNDSLGTLFEEARTDESGRFGVYTQDIKGDWDIVIQMKEKNRKKDYQAVLDRLFSPMPLSYKGYETTLRQPPKAKPEQQVTPKYTAATLPEQETDDTTDLPMDEKDHRLAEITVTAKQRQDSIARTKINITYDVSKELDKMIDTGDYSGSLVEFLLKTNPNFGAYETAGTKDYYYLNQPAIFAVDGKVYPPEVLDPMSGLVSDPVANILLNEVESIEFLNQTSKGVKSSRLYEQNIRLDTPQERRIMQVDLIRDSRGLVLASRAKAMQGGHVLINIKTYPDGKFRAERKGIRHTRLQGYSYTKEFYSPKYDYEVFPDEVDYRRTLYWNPDVKTNTEGKASVSFYNNGAGRQLLIEAETMDASGALGVYTE